MAGPGKNARLALVLSGLVVGMVGLSFAAVPLYRLFCQVTGFGGTPITAREEVPLRVTDREITIRFNGDVHPDLPWQFKPEVNYIRVRAGERKLAFYQVRNKSDMAVAGTATYNVTPEKAGQYFHKTYCFCFEEQWLNPNQEVMLPVSFYVDPAIVDDKNMADVHTITLSYTFFRMKNPDESSKPKPIAQPDAVN